MNDILRSVGKDDKGTWEELMGLRRNGSDPSIEEILKAVGVDDEK
ncbi:hypothetical protein [Lysinibacillus fusiformis]|nr:hypothetical protein [Lysinibacillus fusiformis]MCR8853680.1 hypothetical protein [Lysinibacillus fusiformis]WKT76355.1 hypothetical protein QYY55_20140 [Lysinibacillus fusiformis]